MNINEFLEARIAEDEATAVAAINQRNDEIARGRYVKGREPKPQWDVLVWDDWVGGPAIAMGAERLLAACAAKRLIVDIHLDMDPYCCVCENFPYPCDTVKTLATIYAAHPDYQVEWQP
jgi:hypothetical protein